MFWDMRHVSAVAREVAASPSWWLVLLIVAVAVLIPFLMHVLPRWALGRVGDAMNRSGERLALGLLAGLVVALFAAERFGVATFLAPAFPDARDAKLRTAGAPARVRADRTRSNDPRTEPRPWTPAWRMSAARMSS